MSDFKVVFTPVRKNQIDSCPGGGWLLESGDQRTAFLCTSNTGNGNGNANGNDAKYQNGKRPLDEFDILFAFETASSSVFEIQKSQLAQQKVATQALLNAAQILIRDHTNASQQLQNLAAAKGLQLGARMSPTHEALLAFLQPLNGSEFELSWLTIQVHAHEKAIELFKAYAREGHDRDFRHFAAETLPVLQKHLHLLQKLCRRKL